MLGWFAAGLAAGGLLTGCVLWLLSGLAAPVPLAWREAAVVVLAAAGIARDAGVLPVRLPQNARQIPREVLQTRLLRGTFRFGFELGTGVRTYVPATAPYVVALAVLLVSGGVIAALSAGLGFGAGRALTPVLRYASGDGAWWDHQVQVQRGWLTVGTAVAVTVLLGIALLT